MALSMALGMSISMAFSIPEPMKKVWDRWNLRGFIILSLTLQITLILFAPARKRTSSMLMIFIVWSAYLLADWSAAFAVGLISNSQDDKKRSVSFSPSATENADLLAFWAPFLLVHLGGPDTITAFALEDNALWLRHMIGLLFQVLAAVYVFLQTLPHNNLFPPTIVMLLAGLIKYAERTRALYLASLEKFKESMLDKPDPGPNYAKLMDEYASKKEAQLPTRIEMIAEPNREAKFITYDIPQGPLENDAIIVKHAHHYFEKFKGLIVDLIFSFSDRYESRAFFMARDSQDAFKVILVELNFLYEVLYTKVVVVHSLLGCVFRFAAFVCESIALLLFSRVNKDNFESIDVTITYVLLIGALSLDVVASFMVIFSDWTVAIIKRSVKRHRSVAMIDKFTRPMLDRFLKLRDPSYSKHRVGIVELQVSDTFVLNRRWSECISAYNLLSICMKEESRKIPRPMGWFSKSSYIIFCSPVNMVGEVISFIKRLFMKSITCWGTFYWFGLGKVFMFIFDKIGLLALYEDIVYVSRNPFMIEIWEFIYQQLHDKSHLADDAETAKQIAESKGEWVLQDSELGPKVAHFRNYIDAAEYDRTLLLWHIATEICYHLEDPKEDKKRDENAKKKKEYSKILSDYMLYLLVKQSKMMSSVAGIGQIRYRDTRAEAEKFFYRRGITTMKAKPDDKMKEGCESLLDVNTDVPPIAVKGDRSKSVLFDACMLAKEMLKMTEIDKWEVMSKVWVELLSYAAGHCRADTHAQILSKGGELVTLVWMLLAHFGIGEQFQINEGHARAKLIVGK